MEQFRAGLAMTNETARNQNLEVATFAIRGRRVGLALDFRQRLQLFHGGDAHAQARRRLVLHRAAGAGVNTTSAYPLLASLKAALATVPDVMSCKIGLEANMTAEDYPMIRIVPSRLMPPGPLTGAARRCWSTLAATSTSSPPGWRCCTSTC